MEAKTYQVELYQKAKENNVIIKLNTGSGKTFIASMLIKDYLSRKTDKKIFFLVKNASLAQQHSCYLRQYLFLKAEVGFFHGNMNNSWVDYWSKDKWATEISKYKIIIMTAKVFLDILNHKKYSLDNICLLIFDEVHHLAKQDDYLQISEHLTADFAHIKILGLTACLFKNVKKLNDMEFLMDELEKRLNCQIITSNDSIANEFSFNIRNIFIDFDNGTWEDVEKLKAILDSSLAKIQEMESSQTADDINVSPVVGFASSDNPFQNSRRHINDILIVLNNLGIIPCKCIVGVFLADIPSLLNSAQCLNDKNRCALEEFSSCLDSLREEFSKILVNSKYLNCSAKTRKLIQFIKDLKMRNLSNSINQDNFILIFVTERIQALALNELFNLLPLINDDFAFMKSEFIIGHTTSTYPKKLAMNGSDQMGILNRFREKQFNILIATNVVEEGLDIPHCNVVIKLDPPVEFRSYLQSKGRARADNSQYVIFVSSEQLAPVRFRINFFDQVNKKINDCLKTRAIETNQLEDEVDDCPTDSDTYNTAYMPYGKSGPRITLNSAAGVLNRYIGKLRCNTLSEIKIFYKVEQNSSNLYETSMLLPMPSPYLEEIKGGFHSNKRTSRQFANLEACKILHVLEELDANLLPYNRYQDDDELLSTKESGIDDIGLYEKYIAKKLHSDFHNSEEIIDTLYLYSIRYSPQVFLKLGIEDLAAFDMSSSIGILSRKPIHDQKIVAKFPIYLVGGRCNATVQFEDNIPVTEHELATFLKCHDVLFQIYSQRIRKFNLNISFQPINSKCSLIITILKDFKIDFKMMEKIISREFVMKLTENVQSEWVGSVVRPTYLSREFGAYVVIKVSKNMTALSKLKNSDISYREYYTKEYNISLSEEEAQQPLINVKRLTTIQSCTNKEKRSLKESKRLQHINNRDTNFIPSIVECISLSSSLWTHLCIFPTIHLRLNQIFILQEFAASADFVDLTPSSEIVSIDFDACYKIENILTTHLNLDMLTFISNIYPCFVSKTCNDRLDLEQYEILGDSFLKFITTKYLYHFSKATDNEGKLTQRRSSLISNRNLFNLAQHKRLSQYFFVSMFDPKINYLPPNCVVTNEDEKPPRRNDREFVTYKSKALADCVESLMGCIFTNYGFDYAIRFLLWLNMALLPENNENNVEVVAAPPTLFCKEIEAEVCIPENIQELEQILQYTFKHKAYAVQAITHPTSIENRKFSCYQRLEFVGDAVLDFLVTAYIMVHNPQMRPGKITNLRSALVSNSTFAFLSAKWELHRFINHFDSKIFFALPDVVNSLLQNNLDANTLFLRKSEQHKVIVKVLGDIFESIAGAIFVDSDYNIDIVWQVYQRLMDESLKKFSNHIPKNKIVLLYERYPKLRCKYEVEIGTNLIILTATLPDDRIFVIKESNKVLCKLTLAEELLG